MSNLTIEMDFIDFKRLMALMDKQNSYGQGKIIVQEKDGKTATFHYTLSEDVTDTFIEWEEDKKNRMDW